MKEATKFEIGKPYNWIGQPERLIYMGYNWSGNGYWHQFSKVDEPGVVWCEVLTSDLHMLEETVQDAEAEVPIQPPVIEPAPAQDEDGQNLYTFDINALLSLIRALSFDVYYKCALADLEVNEYCRAVELRATANNCPKEAEFITGYLNYCVESDEAVLSAERAMEYLVLIGLLQNNHHRLRFLLSSRHMVDYIWDHCVTDGRYSREEEIRKHLEAALAS